MLTHSDSLNIDDYLFRFYGEFRVVLIVNRIKLLEKKDYILLGMIMDLLNPLLLLLLAKLLGADISRKKFRTLHNVVLDAPQITLAVRSRLECGTACGKEMTCLSYDVGKWRVLVMTYVSDVY